MALLSPAQIDAYLHRIKFSQPPPTEDRLALLTLLQQHQLVHIPFESLSLHYSQDRQVSIDLQDLYAKIVERRRGGYCLENNAFFAGVLRSLGFRVMSVVCRITFATRGIFDGSWRPMYVCSLLC